MVAIEKTKLHKYTSEQIQFLKDNAYGKYNDEITELFNKEFGLDLKVSQIKSAKNRHKIDSGITGRFEKGNKPWNKGKKRPGFRNSGTFELGHIPSNKRKVGDIRVNIDGYYEMKVKEPNTWKLAHRVVYEKCYGKIKKGHVIVFLDADKTNLAISNLYSVNRSIHGIMNNRQWYSDSADITMSRIILAKLIYEKNNKKRQKKGK